MMAVWHLREAVASSKMTNGGFFNKHRAMAAEIPANRTSGSERPCRRWI